MSELTEPAAPKFAVTYEVAFTKNMGNFESLKINLGLTQEGVGGKAAADLVLARTRHWVEDNLGKAVTEVSAELQGE